MVCIPTLSRARSIQIWRSITKKNTNGIPLNFKRLAYAERQEGLFLIEKGSLTVQRGSNWVNPQTEDTETSIHQFIRVPFAFRKIKAATSVRPPFLPHFRNIQVATFSPTLLSFLAAGECCTLPSDVQANVKANVWRTSSVCVLKRSRSWPLTLAPVFLRNANKVPAWSH